MRAHRSAVVAAFLLGPALALASASGEVRPTSIDVASLPVVSGVALSPDGTRVAWAQQTRSFDATSKAPAGFDPSRATDADRKAGWTTSTQIWMAPAAGGASRQLTQGAEAATHPVWSPDGATLAFLRKKDGKARIHLLPLSGGEGAILDTGDLEPEGLAFSPDGKRIAFTAALPVPEAERAAKWASGGVVRWDREWQPRVLHVVDVAGGKPVAVTRGTVSVNDLDWAPDGKRLAVLVSPSSDPYEASSLQRPAVVTLREGAHAELRFLDDAPGSIGGVRWSPGGRYVAWDAGVGTLTLLNHLVVREVDGPGRWTAASGLDPTLQGFAWNGDGALTALVAEGTRSRLWRLPREGGRPTDTGFAGRVLRGPLSPDRTGKRFAALSSTPDDPWAPTVVDVATGRAHVVARPAAGTADWPRPTVEVFSWKSPEGDVVEGILTVPAGLPPGSRPPLWVFPHGGPDDVSQLGFSSWERFFASRGFAVLRPNYRGSTGYGHAFYAANRGRLGEIEFQDVESGVDALVAAGRVDPDRLFYGSWSWGGYLTAWTIGHTPRYRAAVAGAAVVDVWTQYVHSDVNHGVAADWEFRGNPWGSPATFDGSNPMRHLANARTPTLVLHGQSDERVPFTQGQILHRALRDVGVEVEFLAYPREPHGFQEPAHVAHMLEAWAAWFARHDRS